MTDKTWDAEDPKELPYRFTYSPITGEVFVISFSLHGLGVSMIFEHPLAFHRFLAEGLTLDDQIADKVLQQSAEIFKSKQGC